MILIVEDNLEKLPKILDYVGLLGPIVICPTVEYAIEYIEKCEGKFVLYLDNELRTAKTGIQLLEWILAKKIHMLVHVYITTFGPFARDAMINMCKRAMVPYIAFN